MLKKTVLLLCVLALCGSVQADSVYFNDADPGDSLWGTAGNWDLGVPLAADNPYIVKTGPGAIIPNGYTAVGTATYVGMGGVEANTGELTVEAGGALTLTGTLMMGAGATVAEGTITNSGDISATNGINVGHGEGGAVGTFNMLAGTATTAGHIIVGRRSYSSGTFNMDGGTVTMTTATRVFYLGNYATNSSGTLNMTGGTLETGWFKPGLRGTGTVNMSGGAITSVSGTYMAQFSTGSCDYNMTGGTLDTYALVIAADAGSTGHLQLDGGTITTESFLMGDGLATMDINGDGKLIIYDDVTGLIQGYIDSGLITTAQGGIGTVLYDYNVTTPSWTTVYAPVSPTLVAPAPSGVVDVDLSPTLEWIPADVSGRTAQYLNYTIDPNQVGIVTSVTLGADANSYTIPGPLAGLTTYHWSIDTDYDSGTLTGPYWNFVTESVAPQIAVYDNVVTTTDLLPAIMSATVTDVEGDLVSAAFSATDPGVTLQNEDVSDPYAPTVEVLTAQEGTYEITLTVTDAGANVTVGTAEVSVYDDACEAAQAASSWAGFDYFDYNLDCEVDLTDFSEFALQWLNDKSLKAQGTY